MPRSTGNPATDRFSDRRVYANAAWRLEVHADLPCFHDWIGWYLDLPVSKPDDSVRSGDRLRDVPDPRSTTHAAPPLDAIHATFRIAAAPPPVDNVSSGGTEPNILFGAQSRIDVARRTIESWPSAPAGRRVPMDQGQHFFSEPLVELLGAMDRHPVHAALLTKDEKRVLLVGEAHAGKSSLSALLTQFGWEVHADDLTFLRTEGAGVETTPLPRRIKFRSQPITDFLAARSVSSVTPADPGPRRPADSSLVTVFPCFSPAGPTAAFERLSAPDATRRLLDGSLHDRRSRAAQFHCLCTLGTSFPAFELTYHDADPVELGAALDAHLMG